MSANNAIVATYASHGLAETDAKKLQGAGFEASKLAIVSKSPRVAEVPEASDFGALDAALYNCIPGDRMLDYQAELNAGRFILMMHGTADEIAQAKRILDSSHPEGWDGKADSAVYYGCAD